MFSLKKSKVRDDNHRFGIWLAFQRQIWVPTEGTWLMSWTLVRKVITQTEDYLRAVTPCIAGGTYVGAGHTPSEKLQSADLLGMESK